MDFNLPADAEEMRVATRDAVDALLKLEPRYHETGEVPEQVESTLREMGFYGMAIPEAYGGMPVDDGVRCDGGPHPQGAWRYAGDGVIEIESGVGEHTFEIQTGYCCPCGGDEGTASTHAGL